MRCAKCLMLWHLLSSDSTSRSLTESFQSGIARSNENVNDRGKLLPLLFLLGKHALSGRSQAVVATPPLSRLLDPTSFDPTFSFKPVQHRVEGRDSELEATPGPHFYELSDLIPVPLLLQLLPLGRPGLPAWRAARINPPEALRKE